MNEILESAVSCLRTEAEAITRIIPLLDDEFVKAVELMYSCQGKVVVTGVGKSGHVAAKIAATLSSTGTPAFFLNPLDAFHGDLGMVGDKDVVIMISYSGQTDELLRLMPFFQFKHLPVIGISGNPDSLLAKHSTCHILASVEREACPLNLAPTSSTTVALALGDALACALIDKRGFKANDFARFHPGGTLGKRLLTTAYDAMHRDDLPIIGPDLKLDDTILEMSRGKLGLCVICKDGKILGIITDGDIRRAMQSKRREFFDVKVSEVMTVSPVCIPPTMKVAEAQALMNRRKIHAVIVTDEQGALVGILDSFGCEV